MKSSIAKTKNNEERQFYDSFIRKYYRAMLLAATEIVENQQKAKEIIMLCIPSLLDKVSNLQGMDPQECAAFLVTTVKIYAYASLMNERPNSGILIDNMKNISIDSVQEFIMSQKDMILFQEKREQMGQALKELSERDRLLLICKYYGDMKEKELAQMFHTSEANILTYLSMVWCRVLPLIKEVLHS